MRVEGAQARPDTSAGAAPRNGAASSAQAPTSRAAAKDRETTAKLPASTGGDRQPPMIARSPEPLRARLLERREEPLERVRRVGPGRLHLRALPVFVPSTRAAMPSRHAITRARHRRR